MDCNQLERRRLLKLVAAAAAAHTLDPAARALAGTSVPAPAAIGPPRYIDVHAHIFNGADIPANRFLDIVVLQRYPEQFIPKGLLDDAFRRVLSNAVLVIAEMIKARSPSPDAEIAVLAQKSVEPAEDEIIAAQKSVAEEEEHAADLLEELMHDYALRRNGETPGTFFKDDDWSERIEELDPLFTYLADQRQTKSGPEDATETFLDKSAREEVSKAIAVGNVDIGNLLAWGTLLTRYRYQILEKYLTTYAEGSRKPVLVAPALVDFSQWLSDTRAAEQSRQIAVMALLAQRSRGTLMHGYAAFDPLREVKAREQGTSPRPLELVRQAVTTNGFLGVKLYSPMGFRPIGNTSAGTSFPVFLQPVSNIGAKLDEVLNDLYAWSSEAGVAILAHAANSQEAGPGFGCRAAPYFWLDVLEKHPDIRLCLAHFGDFSDRSNCLKQPYAVPQGTWENAIGEVVKAARAPNVYADLSYFEPAFRSAATTDNSQSAAKLARWIETYDPACAHLLFGTDWSMTQKEAGHEGYIANMERFLRSLGLGNAAVENFFFENAVRFLGLRSGDAARERLGAFFRANAMDEKRLDIFNGAV